MKRYCLHIIILLISFSMLGQQDASDAVIKSDTLRKTKTLQMIGVPLVFYTPETELGFGGGAQFFLLNETNKYNKRVSTVLLSAMYTTNEQFLIDVKPEIFLADGNYFIDANYMFEIYPNKFWGIGPTTPPENEEIYNQTTHKLRINFLKYLPPNLNFGFVFYFANHQVTERQEGGILDSGLVLGSDRAVVSGVGATFNLDSRDDIGSAMSGNYLSLLGRFSSPLLGGTSGYNKFVLDLRTYQPITKNASIAARLYAENNFGNVPFQDMAIYGGSSGARGYFYGRFVDKHMYTLQGEYRWRFRPRWSFNAFGLVGSVDERPTKLYEFKNLKPALGAGIRWKILKNQSTWVRFDYGRGIDGQSGVYFGVNEVF